MKALSRRSLMRLLPGFVIGGKKVLQDTASVAAEQLALAPSGAIRGAIAEPGFDGGAGRTGWALKRLSELADPRHQERERGWFRGPTRLDPDLAACRSMSLSVRIQMQAARDFERSQKDTKSYLDGVIAGIWD